MEIDYIHFYVEDANTARDWFVQHLRFQSVASGSTQDSQTEVICSGTIFFVLSSALHPSSPIAHFLHAHPPGVVDIAFRVPSLSAVLSQTPADLNILQPIQHRSDQQGQVSWSQIAAWGTLVHTLVERTGVTPLLPTLPELNIWCGESVAAPTKEIAGDRGIPKPGTNSSIGLPFAEIDHVVLNVAAGEMEQAVAWYAKVLGFQPRQRFEIQTNHSGLCSRVLVHPTSRVQLPINEPTSASSQIQEFLDYNRAPGIQHIALRTNNIVDAIAQLRPAGLSLLQVPPTYYQQLKQRSQFRQLQANWAAIEAHQVLVDWQADVPQALLLQTFTQPIFQQPTFFFELIERQAYQFKGSYKQAEGFGEGNFRALFEAIEQEQLKRGSLK